MASAEPIAEYQTLDSFQIEVIDLFVGVVRLLGLPRSLGEIYGFIFISDQPVALDDLVEKLGLSKGSASQGLRMLRQFGAIRQTYVSGERREHFIAVAELKKLVLGFLNGQVLPHLENADDRLSRLNTLLREEPATRSETQQHRAERMKKLGQWHQRAAKLTPLLNKILD
jgi:HTH-type transcriptional regulator, glycine betaine synthesis regulator